MTLGKCFVYLLKFFSLIPKMSKCGKEYINGACKNPVTRNVYSEFDMAILDVTKEECTSLNTI